MLLNSSTIIASFCAFLAAIPRQIDTAEWFLRLLSLSQAISAIISLSIMPLVLLALP